MLYNDKQKKIFKKVIKKLKYIEIDGESTQHLLRKIGQEDQMLRQLIMSMPIDMVVDLVKERAEIDAIFNEAVAKFSTTLENLKD